MRTVGIALLVLVLLAGGWTGFWFFAAHEAGRQFDDWMTAEAAEGRSWTCPDRAISGYPFAIAVGCSGATFTSTAMGEGVEAQITHLSADVALWHPRRVALTLAPPFSYRTSDGSTNLQATWTQLTIDLDGLPSIDAMTLRGTKIAVAGTFGDQGRQAGSTARLDARFTLTPDKDDPTADFSIAAEGVPIAVLDQLVGGTAPADISLTGRLDHADVDEARTPTEAIERWRQAGGGIVLTSGSVLRDSAKVTASGTLALDADHRPQGRLDAQFFGLGPILARYGINGDLAGAASLLSALFGGGRTAAPAAPGALALPISLKNGRVAVGPIQTSVELPPLY